MMKGCMSGKIKNAGAQVVKGEPVKNSGKPAVKTGKDLRTKSK